jgi:signal transduction protein with GAF and PtsI domain
LTTRTIEFTGEHLFVNADVTAGELRVEVLTADGGTVAPFTREACVLMEGKMCSLLMLDDGRQWLDLRASYGAGRAYAQKPRLSAEESLLGIVVRRKKPLQVVNVQTSSRYQSVEIARIEGLVSLVSVPLVFGGQPIGTLSVYTGEPHVFSNEEIRILSALADETVKGLINGRQVRKVIVVPKRLVNIVVR